MKAHVVQSRACPKPQPGLVEARDASSRLPARQHPGIVRNAPKARENLYRSRVQRHRPRSRLAIAQPQLAELKVNVIPLKLEDLAAPAPGQHQKADRRNRAGHNTALRLGLGQNAAQPDELFLRQEPLAPAHPVACHEPARVAALRYETPVLSHRAQARKDLDDIADPAAVIARLEMARAKYSDIILVHGGGPGVERIAAQWADRNGVLQIVCKPDWDRHGRAAPFRRNEELLNLLPKGVIAFPGSGITENLVDRARQLGIPVMRAA